MHKYKNSVRIKFCRKPTSRVWTGAMMTEMFQNTLPPNSTAMLCEYKNHFMETKNLRGTQPPINKNFHFKSENLTLEADITGSISESFISKSYQVNFVPDFAETKPICKIDSILSSKRSNHGHEANISPIQRMNAILSFDEDKNTYTDQNIHRSISVRVPVKNPQQISKNELSELETLYNFNYYPTTTGVPIVLNNVYPMHSNIVTTGPDYVNDYLLNNEHGIHIEQNTMPFIYRPLNKCSKGFILCARPLDEFKLDFIFIEIDVGSCMYTMPYAWHTGSYLTGQWEVLYSVEGCNNTISLFSKKNNTSSLLKKVATTGVVCSPQKRRYVLSGYFDNLNDVVKESRAFKKYVQ
jgi:hypothetical protein